MKSKDIQLRRVISLRLGGERVWKAKASDGRRVGSGAGGSWEEAVREAIREIDARRAAKQQP